MSRRKVLSVKWTLVVLVYVCACALARPQEAASVSSDKPTDKPTRTEAPAVTEIPASIPTNVTDANSSRNVKSKTAAIGDSIKMVANQLLDSNTTVETTLVADTRVPPKVKNQVNKQKVKTRNEDTEVENSHVGIAVPVSMEELEMENKIKDISSESSTSNQGISTWILLSNPTPKDNVSSSTTEPTKPEEPQKKQKPNQNKNKTKRPQQKPTTKRPLVASANKSDLVAGGSAINDNVLNKLKDTVLSNVQKNKNTVTQKTTTTTTTTTTAAPEITTKKEELTKTPISVVPVVKVTSKPTKKKNKLKNKVTTTTTTEAPIVHESAMLPMEAKEQEIELEISTPASSTKKPKRSSTKRKKNKTKKRKTSVTKQEAASIPEVKKPEKTELKAPSKTKKTNKNEKKPENPISTQIFSYLSREVMPSVGVGVIGLAGLVGIASYFLYPFATPVRRTFEVDKKDDLYRHNAEEYASEGNGQAEEDMLGTVLAGMPAHSKHKLNPYIGQMANANRYPTKKEQDIKYRHVASSYDSPNFNSHYPQQKTGIAHGAVYSEPAKYNPHQYETRHVYTTESKYAYDNTGYTPYPAVEPIYAAPQTAPSAAASGYGNDASNSVVYGVKPSAETDFKPVYPFEGQVFSETTNSPITYPPTSMYLGSNNEAEQQQQQQQYRQQQQQQYQQEQQQQQQQEEDDDQKYDDEDQNNETVDNKFVVGNVPKELVDSATPAVVPEHGPRNLNRKRRSIVEEILKAAKADNKDIFISNEIDEPLGSPYINLAPMDDSIPSFSPSITPVEDNTKGEDKPTIIPVYAVSMDSTTEEDKATSTDIPSTTSEDHIIESVSTVPFDTNKSDKTTEGDASNELEFTTKSFRVYEVFSSPSTLPNEESSPLVKDLTKLVETTTQAKLNTETTTESVKSETTSTMPSLETKGTEPTIVSTLQPKPVQPTNNPNVITYPPSNGDGSFFTFLKRIVEFKYRLGLSILQTTSDSLNRYLRSMDSAVQKMAKASHA
ncbi:hypothetical protein JYU34_013283 [Plutella xylostella]|uniref:Uncharacterized protein n=1 Tax=Plutella xylostella TaxID=51655 RepID=A0ABQ7Q9L0_PLUXY|nr:hypothetical protein JYU34_013283 [Plutella xylostella]